jgi:hypothetical protein
MLSDQGPTSRACRSQCEEKAPPAAGPSHDRYAEECARAAEQTDDPRHRALLLKLAEEWRKPCGKQMY